MSTTVATKEQSNIPTGYTVDAVVSRFVALDVDAAGNGEKAAWKRYLSLTLLSMAKAWDLKKVAEQVFGKGVKPSKNFQNMRTLAKQVRNNPELLGNHAWADVKVMTIEAAQQAVLDMINRHMAVLSVSSKNDYEKYCEFSAAEAEEQREMEKQAKAEAKAEKDAAASDVAEKTADAEADAQAAAAEKAEPETIVAIALKTLITANDGELKEVIGNLAARLSIEGLSEIHFLMGGIIDAHAKAEEAKRGAAPAEEVKAA